MENFDALLYRPVEEGEKFNDLIPEPNGKKDLMGIGDTGFSVKKMAEMVKNYSHQMEEVANELQSNSLAKSVDNAKDFVFKHFQYKADKEDQLLRSPSYAWWNDGFEGIDCKSYSIIASCILTEMDITHYIRRIKQTTHEPTEWTHVYVVVPIDQKTNNLQKGYYVIDGTLQEAYEPSFLEKNDLLMDLKHYSLNGPSDDGSPSDPPSNPMPKGGLSLDNLFKAGSLLSNFDKIFKDFWQKLRCTAFLGLNESMVNGDDFKRVNPKIANYFESLLHTINQLAHSGDLVALEKAINQYLGISAIAKQCYYYKTADGFDVCSRAGLYAFEQTCFIYQFIGETLKIWMKENYNFSIKGSATTYVKSSLPLNIFEYSDCQSNQVALINNLVLTEKGKEIKAFEITDYVKNNLPPFYSGDEVLKVENYPINATSFLNSLSKSLVSFDDPIVLNPNGNNNPSNPNGSNNQNNPYNPSNPNSNNGGLHPDNPKDTSPQQAGFGVMGWIIVLAGIGIAVKGFANLEDKPANTRKRTTKTAKP